MGLVVFFHPIQTITMNSIGPKHMCYNKPIEQSLNISYVNFKKNRDQMLIINGLSFFCFPCLCLKVRVSTILPP